MFGFLFHRKRDEVKRLLNGRMNRNYMQALDNKSRHTSRGAFCEVVWLIPVDDATRQPEFGRVAPVVTKDICSDGLAIVLDHPVHEQKIIIGLHDETVPRFILCTLQHCTSLGYGHYQIGLHPDEVVRIAPDDVETMQRVLAQLEEPAVVA